MDISKIKITDFNPLWDNVFVKPIKIEKIGEWERSVQEEDKTELGEVINVGQEILDKGYIKVGDIVMFNKYSTTSTDLGEELIVRAEDIVAVRGK